VYCPPRTAFTLLCKRFQRREQPRFLRLPRDRPRDESRILRRIRVQAHNLQIRSIQKPVHCGLVHRLPKDCSRDRRNGPRRRAEVRLERLARGRICFGKYFAIVIPRDRDDLARVVYVRLIELRAIADIFVWTVDYIAQMKEERRGTGGSADVEVSGHGFGDGSVRRVGAPSCVSYGVKADGA
jgi:hypothetical protein